MLHHLLSLPPPFVLVDRARHVQYQRMVIADLHRTVAENQARMARSCETIGSARAAIARSRAQLHRTAPSRTVSPSFHTPASGAI